MLNHKGEKVADVKLEVQSRKTTYRRDYRKMLEDIADQCTDLLLQLNSPVSQNLEIDFNADAQTLYQRFAFLKSILVSDGFTDAVNKIISAPVTRWKDTENLQDIRNAGRFDSRLMRQLASSTNRIALDDSHPLSQQMKSVPQKLVVRSRTETVDTPENRFIKFALGYFRTFISDFLLKIKTENRTRKEARQLEEKLDEMLGHTVFKDISSLKTIPLNSPVLQRKEGYREVLRVWLMFDLAARLCWKGGDDIYEGDKKDVAVLYEYWLFFKLLSVISEHYQIEVPEMNKLIEETADGLNLQLKQGKHIPLQGVYDGKNRKLQVQFSYNRTFRGNQSYPFGQSWTMDMRPDYTLSIWPFGIEQQDAEKEELIVHIHFDAKYKIDNLTTIFGEETAVGISDDDLSEKLNLEKRELIQGNVKRIDLLKMHAYKDAVRRTGGAYVIYPGSEKYIKKGFHEIIPGLGAFAISPSDTGNDGTVELKRFLTDVTNHFMNRTSDREKISLSTYEVYNDNEKLVTSEMLPEYTGKTRHMLPDRTGVLIAYYKDEAHLNWILSKKRYNARTGTNKGSLKINQLTTEASYIVLHGPDELVTGRIYKLKKDGPRILSKADLERIGYPGTSHAAFYLVFEIESEAEPELSQYQWDIRKLRNYQSGILSALPFGVTLAELMKAKV